MYFNILKDKEKNICMKKKIDYHFDSVDSEINESIIII